MTTKVRDYLSAAILYDLYSNNVSSFLEARKLEDVNKAFQKTYKNSPGLERLNDVIDELIDARIITVISNPFASDYFHWEKVRAKNTFQTFANDKDGPFYKAFQLGGGWLSEVIANIAKLEVGRDDPQPRPSIPASDRIVAINHNASNWVDIRSDIESLEELVRSDNSNKIPDLEERSRFKAQLEAARRLMTVKNVSMAALGATIIPVLRHLASTFGDEAIGHLASSLIDAIFKSLGVS